MLARPLQCLNTVGGRVHGKNGEQFDSSAPDEKCTTRPGPAQEQRWELDHVNAPAEYNTR